MSGVRPVEFTDADATEFRLAMRDPEKWKALYDKVDQKNKLNYGKDYGSHKPVNEQGFTDEEVTFLKETFPANEKGGTKRGYRKKRTKKTRKNKTRRGRKRRSRK
jgi:hypothetical protein